MRLHIAPNRQINEIQKDFNKSFPFLKLEFFNNKHYSSAGFSINEMISRGKKIGDTQSAITDGYIDITGEMKVTDLEKIFKNQFSLAVQVFRKSGKIWLETTITDNWTLNQQNNHGSELSSEHAVRTDIEDYDLNRDGRN